MSEEKSFDWYNFVKLANTYIDEDDPAKQRTGISRFYYGPFCSSRDLINEKQAYLNKKSRNIMTSKKGEVHLETRNIYRNHPAFRRNGKIIAKNLDKLRKMRNKADYDKTTTQPLDKMLKNSKLRSERILELLKEYN